MQVDPLIEEERVAAARRYLLAGYGNIEFFPVVPDELTLVTASRLLQVSIPTVARMLEDHSLQLTKQSVQDYIFSHFLCDKPLNLDTEEEYLYEE